MIIYSVGEIEKHGLHLVLGLDLPVIKYGKKELNDFCENYKQIGLKLETKFILSILDNYKYFGITILGFGVYCTIQTGY